MLCQLLLPTTCAAGVLHVYRACMHARTRMRHTGTVRGRAQGRSGNLQALLLSLSGPATAHCWAASDTFRSCWAVPPTAQATYWQCCVWAAPLWCIAPAAGHPYPIGRGHWPGRQSNTAVMVAA
jgi:hypothetical protein